MSTPAKILIVDDEKENCSLLREYFKNQYHVETAFSGAEALRKIKEFQPDCMLLDIRMPNMDGIEVLKSVKQSHSEVRIIMITAVGCVDIARECLRLGAAAYIMKPIDLDALENQIQSVLARQTPHREDS